MTRQATRPTDCCDDQAVRIEPSTGERDCVARGATLVGEAERGCVDAALLLADEVVLWLADSHMISCAAMDLGDWRDGLARHLRAVVKAEGDEGEPCAGCGRSFTPDEWEDRHDDAEDKRQSVHARCCEECNGGVR